MLQSHFDVSGGAGGSMPFLTSSNPMTVALLGSFLSVLLDVKKGVEPPGAAAHVEVALGRGPVLAEEVIPDPRDCVLFSCGAEAYPP